MRMKTAIVLAIVFGVSLFAANQALWLAQTVLDEDEFVATLAPLPRDDAVSLALADQVADAIVEQFGVQDAVAGALPDGIKFISAPVADGIRNLAAEAAVGIIRSDAFTDVWAFALRATHRVAFTYIGALDDGLLLKNEGVLELNLSEIGRQVTEELKLGDIRFANASSEDLTVELFTISDGGVVQLLVRIMYGIRWISLVLAVVLGVAVFAVADDRRRILKWVGGSVVAAMFVTLINLRYIKLAVTSDISDPIQKAGAESVFDIVLRQLQWQTWLVMAIGVVLILIAWFLGDSTKATSLRSRVERTSASSRDWIERSGFRKFVAAHPSAIQVGAALVAAIYLLTGSPLSLIGFILVVLVLTLVIVAVNALASSATASNEPPE